MPLPNSVTIVEVSARDGLQNEKQPVSVDTKVKLIDLLTEAGFRHIEAGSFVSPKWVPQMADTAEVYKRIRKKPGVQYSALVPNEKGMQAAMDAGVQDIAVFVAASESFSQKNINCSIAESFVRIAPVLDDAKNHAIKVRGYVSCVMGCPYEGAVDPKKAALVAYDLYQAGCYEISLGDTIGVGTPALTAAVIQECIAAGIPVSKLAIHCHDTYGRALENIKTALEMGVAVIDASAGGIGGCPYAPGASGNVATEKVAAMLEDKNIEIGIDMQALKKAADFIRAALGKK